MEKEMYQKALDNAIKDIEYKYYDFGVDVPKNRLDEIELLQELVDKEEPRNIVNRKTVTVFIDGDTSWYEGWEDYCPRCKSIIEQNFYEEEVNYCPHCGQRLSWQQNKDKNKEQAAKGYMLQPYLIKNIRLQR